MRLQCESVANKVMFQLDKLENEFSQDELNQITEIVIDYDEEENNAALIADVLLFQNLFSLTIRNGFLYNDDLLHLIKLKKLKAISFHNCKFENSNLVALFSVSSLSLVHCDIYNYSFISVLGELESLTIVSGKIKVRSLNELEQLRYLQLSYSEILGSPDLISPKIEELYIDHSNLVDLSFLKNFKNLRKLGVDESQYRENKLLLDDLIQHDVLVLEDNLIEIRGE